MGIVAFAILLHHAMTNDRRAWLRTWFASVELIWMYFCLDWIRFWKDAPVMFRKVQPEAQETEALIWTGHQQHQEMLYDALQEKNKLVSRTNDVADGGQLLLEALPDISGSGCGAGTASLGLCPGTPGSFFSPPLPARPSLPTDPESDTWIKKHIYHPSSVYWVQNFGHPTSSSLCCFPFSYCRRRESSSRAERYRESWALWNSMIWSNIARNWFKRD